MAMLISEHVYNLFQADVVVVVINWPLLGMFHSITSFGISLTTTVTLSRLKEYVALFAPRPPSGRSRSAA